MQQHGIDERAQRIVWDAIALHSSGSIARWKEPEVALAAAGIVTDVHGTELHLLEAEDITQLLQAAPRANFRSAFLALLTELAQCKPRCTTSSFVQDVGYRLVPKSHLPNFVDEFRSADPFKAL